MGGGWSKVQPESVEFERGCNCLIELPCPSIVASSSSVMASPRAALAMLCVMSQPDWMRAKAFVKASALLRSMMSFSADFWKNRRMA